MRKVPVVMTCEGGVPVPCTRLQHLVDSEVFLEQKRRSDTSGVSRALGGRSVNGSPRELVRPRYRLPEPEGDRVLGDLRDTSCSDKQPLTSRTMCSSMVQVTPDRPHWT